MKVKAVTKPWRMAVNTARLIDAHEKAGPIPERPYSPERSVAGSVARLRRSMFAVLKVMRVGLAFVWLQRDGMS